MSSIAPQVLEFPIRTAAPLGSVPWQHILHLSLSASEQDIRKAYCVELFAMLKRHAAVADNGDQQIELARLDQAYVQALTSKHGKIIL